MTESLIDRIKRHEGLRLAPYQDSRGNWTIGYGHKLTREELKNGIAAIEPITEGRANELLLEDMNSAGTNVYAALPWVVLINAARNGVLIEMAYQMGMKRLLGFKRMIFACENGAYGVAADEMLRSDWHEESGPRCVELAQIMRNGVTT